LAALSVAGFIMGFALWHDPGVLYSGSGDFYRVMPHRTMVTLFGAVSIFAVAALIIGFRNFWRDTGASGIAAGEGPALWQAVRDAASLRYLDGGGVGCYNEDERPTDRRRLFHHLTFYGFLLCFAATAAGTFYHYVLDMPAPYPWYQVPKLLGTVGGIGLVVGPVGLMIAKLRRDPDLKDSRSFGMDTAFLAMLFLAGLTGLLLMALRTTPAMGILLALHLGVVFALFLTLPYGKFVHGLYRFGALVRYAVERRRGMP
jgi:citrate/tricarballylate utilization protein